MTAAIMFDPGPWTVGLPLHTARSAVFWPRRSRVEMQLEGSLATQTSGLSNEDRLVTLATGVICVLRRYGAEVPTIGIGAGHNWPRLLAVLATEDDSISTVRRLIADALRDERLPLAPNAEQEASFNTSFPILLSSDGDVSALPELRHDAGLALDLGGARLVCAYGARLFEVQTVERFLGHVTAFLTAQFVNDSDPIGSVQYMSPAEEVEIDAASRSLVEIPLPSATVQGLFTSAAAKHPDAIAIEADGRRTTYRELDLLSDHIAGGLQAAGVAHPELVALSMRPGVNQIAGVIGILKAGATPVPVDYSFPLARIRKILGTAGVKILLSDGSLPAGALSPIRCLEVHALVNPDPTSSFRADGGDLDDLAYVLFTSGSTGTPKGVAVRQLTLVNLVQWQHHTSSGVGARTLNRSSIAFDVGFQEVFATLCFGHSLIVASETERADVFGLASVLEQRQVDRVFLPPVSLIQMAEAFDEKATPLSSLRQIVVAGEAMRITPSVIRMFRHCGARVTNQYGPTETHVATSFDLPPSSVRWPQLPPIGRPIAHARVYVLDAAGHRCPVGVSGEIAVGGILPASGYLGADEETRQRFVTDPFVDDPESVMYRTGDVGVRAPDGNLQFLGRRDDQVKLRGYRIELGDIEANALTVPGVKLAATVVRERELSGPYLALFIEPEIGSPIEPEFVRAQLTEKLPRHMVPGIGAIVVLSRMPLNANGKIDRRALPDLVEHGVPGGAEESDSVEKRLSSIWCRGLNVGEVKRDDDFLALGGHSLLAIQITSQINDQFGIVLPIATLLQGGSFDRLVDAVNRHVTSKLRGEPVESSPAPSAPKLYSVALANGMKVTAPYPEEAHHYYREIFERNVYFRHGVQLRPDDVVVDVGANIGLFSLAILSRHHTCNVIAVEPAPLLATALRSNLSKFANCTTLLEVGLFDRDGQREFTYYPNLTGMSSFAPDPIEDRALLGALVAAARRHDSQVDGSLNGYEGEHLDARLVSERSMLPVQRLSTVKSRLGLGRIDLLKIDVQRGSEHVLRGIDSQDWASVRQIVVEHQHSGSDSSPVEKWLSSAGYHVATEQDAIHRGTNVVYTYAVRNL